jgi:class 3 adenylate cyclase
LTTVAFVDLAGFTALTEAHGDNAAVQTLDEFERCIRTIASEHGLTD